GTLIDPTGGAGDIEGARIRAVSERVFQDDPLRMLRAVRLAGQLGFEIAASTEALIRRDADQIMRPARERVREELLALLAPPDAAARVGQLDAHGLLAHVLPELDACKGVRQSLPHICDVYDHNLAVLDALEELLDPLIPSPALAPPRSATLRTPRREAFERAVDGGGGPEGPTHYALRTTHPRPAPTLWGDSAPLAPWRERMAQHLAVQVAYGQPRWLLLKLAALLHDVGKPPTRSVGEDGRIHFYRHDSAGARLVEALLRRLKMPANSVAWVSRIVAAHLRPLHLSSRESPRRRSLYRYFQASGAAGPDVALLSIADQRGKGFVEDRAAVVAVAQRILAGYFDEHEKLVAVRPLLDGAAIMATVGIEPGPRVGQLLARLKEAQASGHVRDRESAIKYIRDLTAR
ncbi:MAG TPA: HD domain-containing protein, partial [Ardenticatenaceae bacterium]|nr:HD domain-containing protein [Ardenticatenaceae bacterium]